MTTLVLSVAVVVIVVVVASAAAVRVGGVGDVGEEVVVDVNRGAVVA